MVTPRLGRSRIRQAFVVIAGCAAALSLRAETRATQLLDDGWQIHPLPDFVAWPSQASLTDAQIAQLHCPAPGGGWEGVHLPDDYAVRGKITKEANRSLRAQGATGPIGGREFEIVPPGSKSKDGKPGALNRPGRDAYAGHGYLPVYPAWYRREFTLAAAEKGRSIWLDFGGVYRDAIVFVNGKFVAQHPSGYTGFRVDITSIAKCGETNDVAVFVDPRYFEGWWYEGAGIYRHVQLITADPLHVTHWGTFVKGDVVGAITHDSPQGDQGRARLTVETTVRNDGASPRRFALISQVLDAAGKAVASATDEHELPAEQEATFQQAASLPNAQLWSLAHRNLYVLKTSLKSSDQDIDRVDTSFGIRRLGWDPNNGFFLNDQRVEIQGVCVHQDWPGVGVAAPDNLWPWRIAELQQMGANGYRTAHNPVSDAFYDDADRMGLLVMDETRHFGDTYFPKAVEGTPYIDLSDVKTLVLQGRNHPSVIMWSLANEEGQGPKPYGAKMYAATKAVVKALDPTRPVTGAINGGYTKTGYISVEDILGMNYHNPEFDKNHQTFPNLMIFGSEDTNAKTSRGTLVTSRAAGLVSEYGDGAGAGGEPWASWGPTAARRYVAGQYIWTAIDYRGEPNPYSWPAVTSQTGAMDMCGFPKPVYYYWVSAWKPQPSVYIFPEWNQPDAMLGKTITVRAFSNCEQVELTLNGKSLGKKAMPVNGYLDWEVPYERGTLMATGFKGGTAAATYMNATTGKAAALRLVPQIDRLQANSEDVAPIRVEVVDDQGRVVPDAFNPISFTISGAGTPAGVANGNPASLESNVGTRRTAFHGLCMVLVRSTQEAGDIQIEATSPGLAPAHLVIPTTAMTR